jgi:hypothetical protein
MFMQAVNTRHSAECALTAACPGASLAQLLVPGLAFEGYVLGMSE